MEKLDQTYELNFFCKRWTFNAHNNKIYKDLVSMRVFFFWYLVSVYIDQPIWNPNWLLRCTMYKMSLSFLKDETKYELFIMSFLKETSPPLVRTKTFKETWLDARVKFKIWWKELTTIPDYQYLKSTWLYNVAILFWLQIFCKTPGINLSQNVFTSWYIKPNI